MVRGRSCNRGPRDDYFHLQEHVGNGTQSNSDALNEKVNAKVWGPDTESRVVCEQRRGRTPSRSYSKNCAAGLDVAVSGEVLRRSTRTLSIASQDGGVEMSRRILTPSPSLPQGSKGKSPDWD